MLDSGREQPLAATEVSFHAFPAPGWPAPTAEPSQRHPARRDDADTRLTWPPADVRLGPAGPTEDSTRAAPAGLPAQPGGPGRTASGQAARHSQTSSDADPKSGALAATGEMEGSHDLDWLLSPIRPSNRRADGAPAASMPGLAGRFAAEWCPTSATSGRTALWRVRGRTNGGVMVRRAILDRGDDLAADDEALPQSQVPAARPEQARAHWRGAGGRWLVWVARAIAWAVLLLVGYRGVLAITQDQGTGTPASAALAASGTRFPVTLAEAYAQQFGAVYLNFSPARASQRSRDLARFLPPGADAQLGWNGAGVQHLQSEQVAGISVTGSHTAIVTLLAQLGDGRMLELGVPVYAARGSMTVSGNPALLPGPANVLPPSGQPTSDQATQTALQSQLRAFFQAYASGDRTTLSRFAAPGAHIEGLGGAVRLAAIDSVFVPTGGNRRQISVTVTWDLSPAPSASSGVAASPAALPMTYEMTVVRQAGSWDVQRIGASTQPQGPP
jgi:hypothetical protein